MSKSQFLTKSRFKIGCECPTKLFYLDNSAYGNTNKDNSFLAALAEGGFQVGELAKAYYPGGIEITNRDKDKAAQETADLLKLDKAIIYEAAFKHENLFIKADVVIKNGSAVELIEVKAKSFDPKEENAFYNKTSLKQGKPKLSSAWEPYLLDVAFQTYVLKKAFPKLKISSSLMLADKTALATVDGLNQRFFLEKNAEGQLGVRVADGTNLKTLGKRILICVDVGAEVAVASAMTFENGMNFEEMIHHLSDVCANQTFTNPVVGSQCKSCEFRIPRDKNKPNLKSGFEECWRKTALLGQSDFDRPFVFDVWNFRKSKKLIEDNIYFIDQLSEDDVAPGAKEDQVGLSSSQRQWLQVEKVIKSDASPYFDREGMSREMKQWKYPLHFIDFETTMVAIPFNKGRHPYEQIAFQFSHHLVNGDGSIIHKDEYINRKRGHFPNFDFVRALKAALNTDDGTVFRYATHENTVLCQIRAQLLESDESDREELVTFIETLTEATGDSVEKWSGKRKMVDMCDLVKKYFYHPLTKGSNSIKKVLPAVLNDSDFLKERYSKPIYGSKGFCLSKNYKDWCWIQTEANGHVVDPYKRLPPIFSDLDLESMDSLITDGSIADGGAAMTAYARMQFTQMGEEESEKVSKALLKYCELDTFAMVLIYEYWKNEIEFHGYKNQAA